MMTTQLRSVSPSLIALEPHTPFFIVQNVATQNSGIAANQVTMHHGHRVPRTNTDWLNSQITKAKAPAVPMTNARQNQLAKRAPARMPIPIVMTTDHAIKPMRGLGKPKSDPCQEPRFLPHCTMTLKSQEAASSGLVSLCIFSKVRANAATRPTNPETIRKMGKPLKRVPGSLVILTSSLSRESPGIQL